MLLGMFRARLPACKTAARTSKYTLFGDKYLAFLDCTSSEILFLLQNPDEITDITSNTNNRRAHNLLMNLKYFCENEIDYTRY